MLNQKGTARLHARSIGREYSDCRFIVCHIDGGITVSAHMNGKMVDGTEGAGGEGAFSPTRIGSVPALELARYIEEHGAETIEGLFESLHGCSKEQLFEAIKADIAASTDERLLAIVDAVIGAGVPAVVRRTVMNGRRCPIRRKRGSVRN